MIRQAVGGNFNEDMKEFAIDKFFKNKELNKKELDKLIKKDEDFVNMDILDKSKIAQQDKDIKINELNKLHRIHEEESTRLQEEHDRERQRLERRL